jgi:hypothetical protein
LTVHHPALLNLEGEFLFASTITPAQKTSQCPEGPVSIYANYWFKAYLPKTGRKQKGPAELNLRGLLVVKYV